MRVRRDGKPHLLDNYYLGRRAMFLGVAMRDIDFKPKLEAKMYIT